MSVGEELFVGIISGTISGIIVGIFVLWFRKIKWNSIFFKKRIIKLFGNYEEIKNDKLKEEKMTRKLGLLVDDNYSKLLRLGFHIKHYGGSKRFQNLSESQELGDTIGDNNFRIHLTRYYPNPLVYQFLVRSLDNGNIKIPDEAYFSMKYPSSQKEKNNPTILKDFIKYFKDKK